MNRATLIKWEERVRAAGTGERMAIIHEFADSLNGDQGKIATSILRMTTMAHDLETKSVERKAASDRLLFGISAMWIGLLVICLVGGLVMTFYDKLAATELAFGNASIKTSSIGLVLVLIAIAIGGRVVKRAIDNLRHE